MLLVLNFISFLIYALTSSLRNTCSAEICTRWSRLGSGNAETLRIRILKMKMNTCGWLKQNQNTEYVNNNTRHNKKGLIDVYCNTSCSIPTWSHADAVVFFPAPHNASLKHQLHDLFIPWWNESFNSHMEQTADNLMQHSIVFLDGGLQIQICGVFVNTCSLAGGGSSSFRFSLLYN